MKRIFSLLLIIAVASHFGIIQVFAQKSVKPKEVIIVEFLLPNWNYPSKWKIPIHKSPPRKFDVGGGMVSECAAPGADCTNFIYTSYEYQAKGFAVDKNRTRIEIKIDYSVGDEDCKTHRIFTVYRNRQTKIRLDCGTILTARYGLETEETD